MSRTFAAAVGLTALVLCSTTSVAGSGVALAAGGYGPPSGPAAASPPGGFTAVVVARPVGRRGGTLTTRIGHTRIRIRVPADVFTSARIEVEVTKPNVAALDRTLPRLGLRDDRVLCGVGVAFLRRNGSVLPKAGFRHPLTITFACRGLSEPVHVLEFTGERKVHALRFNHIAPAGKLERIAVTVSGSHDLFVVGPAHP